MKLFFVQEQQCFLNFLQKDGHLIELVETMADTNSHSFLPGPTIWECCLASSRLARTERKLDEKPHFIFTKLLRVYGLWLISIPAAGNTSYQNPRLEITTELMQDLVQNVFDVREVSRAFSRFFYADIYSPECKY